MINAITVGVIAVLVAAGSGGAATSEQSTNWSGYAVTGSAFTVVKGSWVEPAADCLNRVTTVTDSSFWVGLGGYALGSKGIEQIGTDSACEANGEETDYAWYELWPAKSRDIPLRVSPGDRMFALVRTAGTKVTLQLRNLTTGKNFSRMLRLPAPDTSSAEWIAEAPAIVVRHGTPYLPLTAFGSVTFSGAEATSAGGHSGTISDSAWTTRLMVLASRHARKASALQQFAERDSAVRAVPGPLQHGGSLFSVTWKHGSAPAPARVGPPGVA